MKAMNKKNILVIEDERYIMELIKEILSEGYNVIEAVSGEEGIKKAFLRQKIDAVILDVKLPGISGWEVMDNFMRSNRMQEIPVVFLTAVSQMEIEQKAGDYIILKKPFDPEELAEVVDEITGNPDEN